MAQEKVLIVEDEADVLELVRYNLEKNGYLTEEAETGTEAMQKAQSTSPDLMLLDLMLPEIDGLEICKRIKKDAKTASIPVIMLTAESSDADTILGLDAGANDYVI